MLKTFPFISPFSNRNSVSLQQLLTNLYFFYMIQEQQIKIFEEKQVRTSWDSEQEKWYFAIVDVIEVLTDSTDPKQYIKKMKARDSQLNSNWGTICTLVEMVGNDGKKRKLMASDLEGVFRIIQSIPSPKAEPFKQWMSQVAAERINQMQDPELSINQAIADYRRLGYSDKWINQRIQTIKARKELTDEWQRAGVTGSQQYASLTDIIKKAWSGKTTRQYKDFKGLKKESLRDNMTTMELALNMLAEATTTEISKTVNPNGFEESANVARKGGAIAGETRKKIEQQIGHSVISSGKATDSLDSVEDVELLEM